MEFRKLLALPLVAITVALGGCDDPPEAGSLEGEGYEEGLLNVMDDGAAGAGGAVRPDSGEVFVGEGNPQPAGTFELEPGGAVDAGPVDLEEEP